MTGGIAPGLAREHVLEQFAERVPGSADRRMAGAVALCGYMQNMLDRRQVPMPDYHREAIQAFLDIAKGEA